VTTTETRVLRGDHCQCRSCFEYFNSTYAFDKHRTGQHGKDRRCLTTDQMLQRKMAKNAGGWWLSSIPHKDAFVPWACDSTSGDRAEGVP
jgi:hypothetical protein